MPYYAQDSIVVVSNDHTRDTHRIYRWNERSNGMGKRLDVPAMVSWPIHCKRVVANRTDTTHFIGHENGRQYSDMHTSTSQFHCVMSRARRRASNIPNTMHQSPKPFISIDKRLCLQNECTLPIRLFGCVQMHRNAKEFLVFQWQCNATSNIETLIRLCGFESS